MDGFLVQKSSVKNLRPRLIAIASNMQNLALVWYRNLTSSFHIQSFSLRETRRIMMGKRERYVTLRIQLAKPLDSRDCSFASRSQQLLEHGHIMLNFPSSFMIGPMHLKIEAISQFFLHLFGTFVTLHPFSRNFRSRFIIGMYHMLQLDWHWSRSHHYV